MSNLPERFANLIHNNNIVKHIIMHFYGQDHSFFSACANHKCTNSPCSRARGTLFSKRHHRDIIWETLNLLTTLVGSILNPDGSYLIPIPTIMSMANLYTCGLHMHWKKTMVLTIKMHNIMCCCGWDWQIFQANLTTNFMCACANYFGQIWQLMWTSMTIVSGKFDNDFLCMSVWQLKFCVIQFCLLWNSIK